MEVLLSLLMKERAVTLPEPRLLGVSDRMRRLKRRLKEREKEMKPIEPVTLKGRSLPKGRLLSSETERRIGWPQALPELEKHKSRVKHEGKLMQPRLQPLAL
jgi:hypothetical protein